MLADGMEAVTLFAQNNYMYVSRCNAVPHGNLNKLAVASFLEGARSLSA